MIRGIPISWHGLPCALALWLACAGCDVGTFSGPDIETGFAFTNFSTTAYAALQLRTHDDGGSSAYFATPLLAPGATTRLRFVDSLGEPCPDALDLRLLLYERVNADLPIGLDDAEEVATTPMRAGQIEDVPVCRAQTVETLTIVNWDSRDDLARVKIAQGTPLDSAITAAKGFDNVDGAWEFSGVDSQLATAPPPPLADDIEIDGRVTTADGTGIEGVVVVLRSRFRIRLADADEANDPDSGFSEPIDFRETAADGTFKFERPPGVYRVEFFSDVLLFRPATIDIEAPSGEVVTIASSLEGTP